MFLARAAALAALIVVCLSTGEAASGMPATSGADSGVTEGVEKTHVSAERTSAIGSERTSSAGLENRFDSEKRSLALIEQKILSSETENWRRLKDGDVIVDADDKSDNRFVVARILIADTPANVWRVLANPFEFQGKISPRMKDVEILHDANERSIMKCKMEIFPPLIPFISYTVASDYRLHEFIQFKRISGSLKDFSGTWSLAPREGGHLTEVTYSMHVDPGLPVPQWIIRKAMRSELPRTLIALRKRVVNSEVTVSGAEPIRTIMAVGPIDSVLKHERTVPAVLPLVVPQKHSGSKHKSTKLKHLSLLPQSLPQSLKF